MRLAQKVPSTAACPPPLTLSCPAHSSLPQSPSAGIQPGSPPLQGSTDAASLAEIAPPLAEWSETVLAQAVPEFALLSGSLVSATGGIILEAG